jgi:hypothetical protein
MWLKKLARGVRLGQGLHGFGLSPHKLNTPMKIMYLLAYNLLCFMVYHFIYSQNFQLLDENHQFFCGIKNHCTMQKHSTSTFEKQ